MHHQGLIFSKNHCIICNKKNFTHEFLKHADIKGGLNEIKQELDILFIASYYQPTSNNTNGNRISNNNNEDNDNNNDDVYIYIYVYIYK